MIKGRFLKIQNYWIFY